MVAGSRMKAAAESVLVTGRRLWPSGEEEGSTHRTVICPAGEEVAGEAFRIDWKMVCGLALWNYHRLLVLRLIISRRVFDI